MGSQMSVYEENGSSREPEEEQFSLVRGSDPLIRALRRAPASTRLTALFSLSQYTRDDAFAYLREVIPSFFPGLADVYDLQNIAEHPLPFDVLLKLAYLSSWTTTEDDDPCSCMSLIPQFPAVFSLDVIAIPGYRPLPHLNETLDTFFRHMRLIAAMRGRPRAGAQTTKVLVEAFIGAFSNLGHLAGLTAIENAILKEPLEYFKALVPLLVQDHDDGLDEWRLQGHIWLTREARKRLGQAKFHELWGDRPHRFIANWGSDDLRWQ